MRGSDLHFELWALRRGDTGIRRRQESRQGEYLNGQVFPQAPQGRNAKAWGNATELI